MDIRKHFSIVTLALLSSLVLSACGGSSDPSSDPDTGGGETPPPSQPSPPPPPVNPPTITLNATPNSVSMGGTSTISWSTTDATNCTAAGNWSGTKTTGNVNEVISGINQNSSYTLNCTGPGGQASRTVNVTVVTGTGALVGSVDSSYINREGVNAIYIFNGQVTPDDYDGDNGDPILSIPVTQISNTCLWEYSVPTLAAGDYTLALTSQAGIDDSQANDNINFKAVINVNISGVAMTQDFAAQNIIRVGPGRTYTNLSQAADVASDGDVVEVDSAIYIDDISVWRQNNLTIRGVGGGRAHLMAAQTILYSPGNDQANGKGIIVTRGTNINIENIEFSQAKLSVADGENAAGIRLDGYNLNVCNCYFHDNQNGMLGGSGTVLVEYSEFDNNGLGEYGRTHNMYMSADVTKFTLQHSYTHHANIGHNVKTRASENFILYNRIMDEVSGNSSYGIDISNGGLTYIIGNLIQQGTNTGNSTLVNYGAEGLRAGRTDRLYIVNNTIVNDRGSGTFIAINNGRETADVMNNIFVGNGNLVNGSATMTTNLVSNSPGLMDRVNFVYHLTANSNAQNSGTPPGVGTGFSLTPSFQYVDNSQTESRSNTDGSIDIGAYER